MAQPIPCAYPLGSVLAHEQPKMDIEGLARDRVREALSTVFPVILIGTPRGGSLAGLNVACHEILQKVCPKSQQSPKMTGIVSMINR